MKHSRAYQSELKKECEETRRIMRKERLVALVIINHKKLEAIPFNDGNYKTAWDFCRAVISHDLSDLGLKDFSHRLKIWDIE